MEKRISAADWLMACEWVQMLPPVAKERIVADSFERNYDARDVVAHLGEPAMVWLGVIEGLLKVTAVTPGGQPIMFTAIPEGSWVGEGSVIKKDLRRYDLTAIRKSRVIHVPRATFMWLLGTSNEFCHFIINHLNERTGQFLGMLEVGRIHHPPARIAGAICNLFNAVLYPKAGPLFKISQAELGELAGLSRTTTSSALDTLRKRKLISTEYGGILVLDREGLMALVQSAGD